MSLMENLLKLFRVDSQVRGLRNRLDAARRYANAQNRLLDEISQRKAELETRRRHVQAKIANLESEGAGLDEQLEKFRRDLNSASTNKQYSAVLAELNTVKVERGKIDDVTLAEMDQVERLDAEIAQVEADIIEREKVRDVAVAQLREREEDVGERLNELEQERTGAAADLPSDALAIFENVSETHHGEAMAAVEEIDRRHREYACAACNMHMPFEQIASLMGSSDQIIRCTACGRILFLQEDLRGALTPK
jgi:predicted  nucleic acid-binding Zn-ribbon protein